MIAGRTSFRFWIVLAFSIVLAARNAPAQWWEAGFDRWHYKDDWTAEFVSGARTYGTTITIPGEIESAWVQVWAEQYSLNVNTEHIGNDQDAGTIEIYDLTEVLHPARNQILIEGGRQVIVDGGAVLTDGRIVPIRSDATWGLGRTIKTSRERTTGPRGYIGNAHQAAVPHYTPEQRAKATVSSINSLVRRLRDRDLFRFFRVCRPGELLDFESEAYELWTDVLEDSTEASTVTDLAEAAIARGEWAEAERIVNAPPRPVAPHIVDTASDLEIAIDLRSLENDYSALRLQLDLIDRAGQAPEPSWEPRLQQIRATLDRAVASQTQDRLRPYIAGEIREEIAALRSDIEARMDLRLDGLNRSTQNHMGWVISNLPLDNDPRTWEFSFAPPSAEPLDLAGVWHFRLDPEKRGEQAGYASEADAAEWDRVIAPHAAGWERLGYTQDDPKSEYRPNKPYNGVGWYRKTIATPPEWKGRGLEIDLGEAGNNKRTVYWNGGALASEGDDGRRFRIPAAGVRAGAENTIAIRVENTDNKGGLLGPRLWLYPADARPTTLRTICQAGIFQAIDYGDGPRQAAYCGALSPGILVSQTSDNFRLTGWEPKGWSPPSYVAFLDTDRLPRLERLEDGFTLTGDALGAPWILLLPNPDAATSQPEVAMVVLQKRPRSIHWETGAARGSALQIDYGEPAAIVGLARPLPGVVPLNKTPDGRLRLRPYTDSVCNRWARVMRAYPYGYAEIYSEVAGQAHVHLAYKFFETDDDWNTEHVQTAPLPMLFSYARDERWSQTDSEVVARLHHGARATADPRQTYTGPLMARLGDWAVSYRYGLRKPRQHWKGIGLWTELREMTDTDFDTMRKWGANAARPQIPFDRSWYVKGFFDVPDERQSGLEGELRWSDDAVEWLDEAVNKHRRNGLMCVLNWFFNADYPIDAIGGAPANSTRYWNYRPESRQLIIDFWAKVAEHFAGLPRDDVAYDLLNEPAFLDPVPYNAFIKDATAAIREHDRTHTIFVESANGWAQPEDFDWLEATGDPNTIYEFHFYGPHTHDSYQHDIWFPRLERDRETFVSEESLEERLLPPLRFSIRSGGAELCHGEFGITFLGPDEAPRQWLESLLTLHQKHDIHWFWWNWQGDEIHRTGLVAGERVNPLVRTLREFMAR